MKQEFFLMGSYSKTWTEKLESKTNERIFCAWCQQWKHGHIVQNIHHEELTEHGTDEWTDVKWKIHKHQKGNTPCIGSDKIVIKKGHC